MDENDMESGENPTEPSMEIPPLPPGFFLALSSVFYFALFLAGFIWIRWRGDHLPLYGKLGMAAELGIGLAGGVGVAALWYVAALILVPMKRLEKEFRAIFGAMGGSGAVGLALLSGVAEEVFFRGALQPVVGLIWASLLFGGVHLGPKRIFMIWTGFAIAMGFVFGWIFDVTGGLAAPVALHVTVNLINLVRMAGKGESAKN